MKKLLLILALAYPAFAARTIVTDTLTRADGSTCSGSMSISYPSFISVTSQLIFAGTIPVSITNGLFSVSLEPGNFYTVSYVTAPSGCTPTTEFWNVPTSATPVNLAAVRTLNAPSPGTTQIPLSFLAQGGATTSQCISWNGATWVPGTCGGGGGGTPSGPNLCVQFDNSGSFGADSTFCFNPSTKVVSMQGVSITDTAHSTSITAAGKTSGGWAITAADVAGTAVSYVWPTSIPMSFPKSLQITGTTTCPTLASGVPTTCYQLAWQ
jgi:hypothetical protein